MKNARKKRVNKVKSQNGGDRPQDWKVGARAGFGDRLEILCSRAADFNARDETGLIAKLDELFAGEIEAGHLPWFDDCLGEHALARKREIVETLNTLLFYDGGCADRFGLARLGGFTVRKILSYGGFGTALLVTSDRDMSPAKGDTPRVIDDFVLKIYHRSSDPQVRERNRASIEHTHAVLTTYLDNKGPWLPRGVKDGIGEDAVWGPYLVTTLVRGTPLDQWLAEACRSQLDVLEVCRQLAMLVRELHSTRAGAEVGGSVVHGDLSPTNVLVLTTSDAFDVGLVDFEQARCPSLAHNSGRVEARNPDFAAPEIIEGGSPTAESDRWSLAAIVEFACRHVLARTERNSVERAWARMRQAMPWGPILVPAIEALLSPAPRERRDLESLIDGILHAIQVVESGEERATVRQSRNFAGSRVRHAMLSCYLDFIEQTHGQILGHTWGEAAAPVLKLRDVFVPLLVSQRSEAEAKIGQSRSKWLDDGSDFEDPFSIDEVAATWGDRERARALTYGSSTTISDLEAQRKRDDEARSELLAEVGRTHRVVDFCIDANHGSWVLRGDPGSGKSTIAHWLAFQHAMSLRSGQCTVRVLQSQVDPEAEHSHQEISLGPPLVPIFIRAEGVRDFLARLGGPGILAQTLLLAAAAEMAKCKLPVRGVGCAEETEWAQLFLDLALEGRLLVVVDGLDEVAGTGARRDVAAAVNRFIEQHAGPRQAHSAPNALNLNRCLVTSRVFGYDLAALPTSIPHYMIERLEEVAVERMGCAWVAACYAASEGARSEAAAVQARFRQELGPIDENLKSNPLLLSILAAVFVRERRLPPRKSELYRIMVDGAIEEFVKQTRGLLKGRAEAPLDEKAVLDGLAELAFMIQDTSSLGLVKRPDMVRMLSAKWKCTNQETEATLERLSSKNVLLLQRGSGFFGIHRTFQEYLAGRYLCRHTSSASGLEVWDELASFIGDDRWVVAIELGLRHASLAMDERGPDDFDTMAEGLTVAASSASSDGADARAAELIFELASVNEERVIPSDKLRKVLGLFLLRCARDENKKRRATRVESLLPTFALFGKSVEWRGSYKEAVLESLQTDDLGLTAVAARMISRVRVLDSAMVDALLRARAREGVETGHEVFECLSRLMTCRFVDSVLARPHAAGFDAPTLSEEHLAALSKVSVKKLGNRAAYNVAVVGCRAAAYLRERADAMRFVTSNIRWSTVIVGLFGGLGDDGALDSRRDTHEANELVEAKELGDRDLANARRMACFNDVQFRRGPAPRELLGKGLRPELMTRESPAWPRIRELLERRTADNQLAAELERLSQAEQDPACAGELLAGCLLCGGNEELLSNFSPGAIEVAGRVLAFCSYSAMNVLARNPIDLSKVLQLPRTQEEGVLWQRSLSTLVASFGPAAFHCIAKTDWWRAAEDSTHLPTLRAEAIAWSMRPDQDDMLYNFAIFLDTAWKKHFPTADAIMDVLPLIAKSSALAAPTHPMAGMASTPPMENRALRAIHAWQRIPLGEEGVQYVSTEVMVHLLDAGLQLTEELLLELLIGAGNTRFRDQSDADRFFKALDSAVIRSGLQQGWRSADRPDPGRGIEYSHNHPSQKEELSAGSAFQYSFSQVEEVDSQSIAMAMVFSAFSGRAAIERFGIVDARVQRDIQRVVEHEVRRKRMNVQQVAASTLLKRYRPLIEEAHRAGRSDLVVMLLAEIDGWGLSFNSDVPWLRSIPWNTEWERGAAGLLCVESGASPTVEEARAILSLIDRAVPNDRLRIQTHLWMHGDNCANRFYPDLQFMPEVLSAIAEAMIQNISSACRTAIMWFFMYVNNTRLDDVRKHIEAVEHEHSMSSFHQIAQIIRMSQEVFDELVGALGKPSPCRDAALCSLMYMRLSIREGKLWSDAARDACLRLIDEGVPGLSVAAAKTICASESGDSEGINLPQPQGASDETALAIIPFCGSKKQTYLKSLLDQPGALRRAAWQGLARGGILPDLSRISELDIEDSLAGLLDSLDWLWIDNEFDREISRLAEHIQTAAKAELDADINRPSKWIEQLIWHCEQFPITPDPAPIWRAPEFIRSYVAMSVLESIAIEPAWIDYVRDALRKRGPRMVETLVNAATQCPRFVARASAVGLLAVIGVFSGAAARAIACVFVESKRVFDRASGSLKLFCRVDRDAADAMRGLLSNPSGNVVWAAAQIADGLCGNHELSGRDLVEIRKALHEACVATSREAVPRQVYGSNSTGQLRCLGSLAQLIRELPSVGASFENVGRSRICIGWPETVKITGSDLQMYLPAGGGDEDPAAEQSKFWNFGKLGAAIDEVAKYAFENGLRIDDVIEEVTAQTRANVPASGTAFSKDAKSP